MQIFEYILMHFSHASLRRCDFVYYCLEIVLIAKKIVILRGYVENFIGKFAYFKIMLYFCKNFQFDSNEEIIIYT